MASIVVVRREMKESNSRESGAPNHNTREQSIYIILCIYFKERGAVLDFATQFSAAGE